MIAVRIIWYDAIYYFRVERETCIISAFYPHSHEPYHPRVIPAEVACQALRELYSQMRMH